MSWWAGSEIPLSSTPGICGYLQNTWQMLDNEICLISQCSLMYLINMQSKTSEDTAKTAARWVLWMHKTSIKIKKKNNNKTPSLDHTDLFDLFYCCYRARNPSLALPVWEGSGLRTELWEVPYWNTWLSAISSQCQGRAQEEVKVGTTTGLQRNSRREDLLARNH